MKTEKQKDEQAARLLDINKAAVEWLRELPELGVPGSPEQCAALRKLQDVNRMKTVILRFQQTIGGGPHLHRYLGMIFWSAFKGVCWHPNLKNGQFTKGICIMTAYNNG